MSLTVVFRVNLLCWVETDGMGHRHSRHIPIQDSVSQIHQTSSPLQAWHTTQTSPMELSFESQDGSRHWRPFLIGEYVYTRKGRA